MALKFSRRAPSGARPMPNMRQRHLYRTTRRSRTALWKQRVIGVDGEGWGEDNIGRQEYKLFVAADDAGWSDHLYAPDGRLKTDTLLRWIFELPEGFLTGFYFGYDVAMTLIDWPLPRLEALKDRSKRPILLSDPRFHQNYVQWHGWWIDWFPGKRFIIRRGHKSRTVWDAGPWHQTSFVNVVGRSKLASEEELALIIEGKQRRGEVSHSLEEELRYAVTEC